MKRENRWWNALPLLAVFSLRTGCGADDEIRQDETTMCADRPWSSGPNDVQDRARVVDAPLGSAVRLSCHYCGENDRGEPRFWYTSSRHGLQRSARKEVALGMADPLESNRVHMTSDRSLVIQDLAPADVARYTCSGLGAEDHVQFALDVLPAAAPEGLATAGNASADSMAGWTRYESQYLTPVAAGYPRQVQRMEADWDAWGPCDGCTGKRYRRAACRVRFVDGTRAACRSVVGLPAIVSTALAATLSTIPDFSLSETCYAYCKNTKKHRFPKYRNAFVPEEGSSLTLVCAEATVDSKVTWRRDGLLLTESDVDVLSGVLLDKFGTLSLVQVTAGDSGNYTCYVDGRRMQEVLVSVRKSSVLGSSEFVRHLCYLFFVFGLNFVVFVVRIYYALLDRHAFVKITEEDVLMQANADEIPIAYLGKRIRVR